MAGRGRPPNPDRSQVRRRNKEAPVTVVTADGKEYGPELPDGYNWPPATQAWWHTWRTCPQASRFTQTDWDFLVDTAVLHAEYWMGDRKLAAELRLRAAKFGATPEDRARLKIAIGEPDTPPDVPATRLRTKAEGARRGRLLQVVADGSS